MSPAAGGPFSGWWRPGGGGWARPGGGGSSDGDGGGGGGGNGRRVCPQPLPRRRLLAFSLVVIAASGVSILSSLSPRGGRAVRASAASEHAATAGPVAATPAAAAANATGSPASSAAPVPPNVGDGGSDGASAYAAALLAAEGVLGSAGAVLSAALTGGGGGSGDGGSAGNASGDGGGGGVHAGERPPWAAAPRDLVRHAEPLRLTYCEEDYAAGAVRALAATSGGTVRARPDWADAHALIKSAWGRCAPSERAAAPMAVVAVDMEPTLHAWGTPSRPIISTVRVEGGTGSPAAVAAAAAPPDAASLTAQSPASVVHIPYAFFSFGERAASMQPERLLRGPGWDAVAVLASKTRFAAWASRHCTRVGPDGRTHVETARARFFTILSDRYKRVDALGACKKNAEPPAGRPPPELDNDRGMSVWWYRAYKFSFAMENSVAPGYMTEKVINSYLAETVPIYWGTPDFGDYFNAAAVVVCEEGPAGDFAACVDEVRRLDTDDEAYLAKLREPLFKGNVVPKWMTWPPYAKQLRQALAM